MSIAGNLFNLLGITGSGIATSDITPRVIGPAASEHELAEFLRNSQVQDPNLWSHYNTAMNRPTTFDEMMRLWSDMSTWDMVTAALTELVEEASQTDPTTEKVIWYECSDKDFEEELNSTMLVNVDAETILPSQLWHVAGFGNNFDKIHYEPDVGVLGLSYAHPMDVRRYWLQKNHRCVGFSWKFGQPDKEPLYAQGAGQIQRPVVSYGGTPQNLWYPWDFLHLRRMFRMRTNEHGEPVFDEVQGIYKKLRMAIDQMTVHRAQVQPDRYVMNIDVQEQPPNEQVRTVQRWKQTMRSKLAFGQGAADGLTDANDLKSYYNAWSLDTILWMAKPKGFQHSIEKLAGTANVPDVYDIEMLLNIFYSVIGMPKSWVGIGQPGEGGPQSGRALLAQDMRFLRKVRALRKPVLTGYTWLGYMHAVLKGKDIRSMDIKAKMSYIGTLEDELRLDNLEKQVDIMTKMAGMLKELNLDKEAWLDLVLRKYMHMPDELVNALRTALPEELPTSESKTRAPLHAGDMKQSGRRLREALATVRPMIESHYGKTVWRDLQRQIAGDKPIGSKPRGLSELARFQMLPPSASEAAKPLLEAGTVISSFDTLENASIKVGSASRVNESTPVGPAYRRWSPVSTP